ncbi:hypothetical protein XENTR_v10011785 [Xenopus tropicalis]|uniref:Box C/D snoRNA protein 1 n=1 Tax=Xenopus tropicalis TaxID=8364 RepID=A0A6I8T0Q4_XENTR|nr:box C/D snoRNA protein 1 [Xenopus tropicalis]KAE8609352.1 hypothetical protein XENTR_v10011785 [Xenopus tropicalis]KAE8609353.1 hypothetical protein XENTR_v10011785 [Xenopus tropicalis]KAE8609354.1 hypothetical protein XENTR_v10011785 [Xenopus tropicalis]
MDSPIEVSVTGGKEDEPVSLKRKMSLFSCEICGGEEAKYKCPRCMKYSCSLPCVKKHKTEVNCSGLRDKAAFVPMSKFNEINLLSDYRFLEDTSRLVDCGARDRLFPRHTSNKYLNLLKNRARRHNIDLKILPIGFTKRRVNSTFFHKKEQRFYWHLKLIFPQSHAEYTEKRVPDNKILNTILEKYIDSANSDPVIRQRLKTYVMSQSGVKVYMKLEQGKCNPARFYELDPSESLLKNLENKTVIEYPTLYVVLMEFTSDIVVLGKEHVQVSPPDKDQEEKTDASKSYK